MFDRLSTGVQVLIGVGLLTVLITILTQLEPRSPTYNIVSAACGGGIIGLVIGVARWGWARLRQ